MNTANKVRFVALLASHQEAVGCEVHRASADAGVLIVLTALAVRDAGYAPALVGRRRRTLYLSNKCAYLLFLWLFPSCRVAGMTDDLSSPHRPVRLLARSQCSTFQISLTRVFPSCFRSSSLPFPWYIRPQHFPQYVFAISPHHMPVPVQSSLGDLLEACATLVIPRMCSFLILSLRVTPHIHRSILISVTSINVHYA